MDMMTGRLTSIPALMFSNLLLPICFPSLDGEKETSTVETETDIHNNVGFSIQVLLSMYSNYAT